MSVIFRGPLLDHPEILDKEGVGYIEKDKRGNKRDTVGMTEGIVRFLGLSQWNNTNKIIGEIETELEVV